MALGMLERSNVRLTLWILLIGLARERPAFAPKSK